MGIHTFFVLPVWERSMHCEHCDVLPLRTLQSRLAFFHNEGAQAQVPQGSGPVDAEAQWRLQTWGSQIDLSAELETDTTLSLPSPDRFSASSQGWEARAAVSSTQIEAQKLLTIWFWGIRCCYSQCKRYWEFTTSVLCLWGACWGCNKSGRLASREGGRSF